MLELVGLTPTRGQAPGAQLLARHAPAARHRHRAARRPQVLILDEPANGLDPAGIRWMRDLLTRLRQPGRHRAAVLAPAARDRGHRRRPGRDRERQDRRGRHQGRAARRGGDARPLDVTARPRHTPSSRPGSPARSPGTARSAPTPTPPGRGRGPDRRHRPHRAPAPPRAPGSKTCSSRSPPTPNAKELRHDRHDHPPDPTTEAAPARRSPVPSRPLGSSRSSSARCSTPAPASGCSSASAPVAASRPGRVIVFAPDSDVTYDSFARGDRVPDVGDPADHRDPGGHERVEPAQRADDVHAGAAAADA